MYKSAEETASCNKSGLVDRLSETTPATVGRYVYLPCPALLYSTLPFPALPCSTLPFPPPRDPANKTALPVYHHPLDKASESHAKKWFSFLGTPDTDPPHPATISVWGRDVQIPLASGRAARFTFDQLIGRATGAADYIEMMRSYDAFVVTDVPGMSHRERDWARRFITFIDAVYESHAKLVLTTAVPLSQLFMSRSELDDSLEKVSKETDTSKSTSSGSPSKDKKSQSKSASNSKNPQHSSSDRTPAQKADAAAHNDRKVANLHADSQSSESSADVDDVMRTLMDDLGMSMSMMKRSSLFSGDEERFAFARALSRLSEMGSQEWVERGMGLEHKGGLKEMEGWKKVRSRWREDSM